MYVEKNDGSLSNRFLRFFQSGSKLDKEWAINKQQWTKVTIQIILLTRDIETC